MRFRPAGLLLPFLLIGCDAAGSPPTGPAKAVFETVRRDLGDIPIAPQGRIVEFPVVNRGLSDLRINKLAQSCSCVDATAEPSILKPGATGRVAVAIAPNRAEEKSATVEVHTNDPSDPVQKLHVSWRSHAPMELDPLEIDFGRVRPGQTVQRSASLLRHGSAGETCEVTEVSATPAERVRIARTGDRLSLTLLSASSPGPQHGTLTVHLDGCWRKDVSIPLRWHVADVIEVQPRELLAGSGTAGERVTGRVIVSAEPGSRLEIDDVSWRGESGDADVASTRLTAERAIAEIVWTLPADSGTHRGELVIECSGPKDRTLRVPVSAYVLGESVVASGDAR
ncbi:MAG: DUF1573 domain-containing protein [Planctomycetaceae bacterium]